MVASSIEHRRLFHFFKNYFQDAHSHKRIGLSQFCSDCATLAQSPQAELQCKTIDMLAERHYAREVVVVRMARLRRFSENSRENVLGMILAPPSVMSIDARIKKFFPGLLAMMIALVAYQQALGLAHLFVANLGGSGTSFPDRFRERVRAILPPEENKPDGSAILARNPFDSITGPLNPEAQPAPPIDSPLGNGENPYGDPICDAGRVTLITADDDPSWSFAAIAMGTERAVLHRIGDGVGDRVLYAMVWDRVWMMKGTQRCQLPLGGPQKKQSVGNVMEPPCPKGSVACGHPPKIHCSADGHCDVDRSIIASIMEERVKLFRGVQVIPTHDENGPSLKIKGIKPGSLLSLLGMVDGDKLQKINGFDMSDPMVALQAYQRLLTADRLDVKLIRAGKPVSLEVNMH